MTPGLRVIGARVGSGSFLSGARVGAFGGETLGAVRSAFGAGLGAG